METKLTMPGVRPKANTFGIVTITGLIAAAGMALYFLIMRLFGLHTVVELRYLNMFFMFGASIYTISHHKHIQGRIKYLEGLKVGFLTSIVAAGAFAIFMLIYLINDPGFVHYLNVHANLHNALGPVSLATHIFIESLTAGAIFGFVAMQFYRTRA